MEGARDCWPWIVFARSRGLVGPAWRLGAGSQRLDVVRFSDDGGVPKSRMLIMKMPRICQLSAPVEEKLSGYELRLLDEPQRHR